MVACRPLTIVRQKATFIRVHYFAHRMKQILDYLKKYFEAYFNLKLYLSVAIFLALCISTNFYFDFQHTYLDPFRKQWIGWPIMSMMMAFPFLSICFFTYWMGDNKEWLTSKEFWVKFVIGFAIIGFERSFYGHHLLAEGMSVIDRRFFLRVMGWGKTYLTTFLPILIFYWYYEKSQDDQQSWFGLTTRDTNFKPYFLLIVVVFVGIAIASYISELHTYYPRYQFTGGGRFAALHQVNEWVSVVIYEFVYGSYFLNVELFFRGFLVIGFARVLGGHAVLAMVGSYVFLHFGKPIAECISSAFGGYLIGVLALYSHRIWGGVVLHVALAWSMELFAWMQNAFED